ncbi:MAG: D-tyrosyl-tRNA(Tyr) deacylase [Planctomycetes bacterium]|nr:D-tyrosyl-tRNA(Tyr) deacylase [Planctomycetota bacterium]
MRALLQRVHEASVRVGGRITGAIGKGLLVLLGVRKGDTADDALWLAGKVVSLRIFPDEQSAMNRSLGDVGGDILLISQFTLYADCRKGRRPSFDAAEAPESAETLYRIFAGGLEKLGHKPEEGVFGAHMDVHLVNDGPVTMMVESPKPLVA